MSTAELFRTDIAKGYVGSGATFSPDRLHRYRLWREWGDTGNRCVWIGVNPSTATETIDDATIRKCVGFSKRWGFGAYDMLNIFGWRSTDIHGLRVPTDPIGPGNDAAIAEVCAGASRVVLAWGSAEKFKGYGIRYPGIALRGSIVYEIVKAHARCEIGHLGLPTNDGQPRHPLFLGYATPFVPIREAR